MKNKPKEPKKTFDGERKRLTKLSGDLRRKMERRNVNDKGMRN
jgi:hypothetical protein